MGGVLRQRSFRHLFAAATVSHFGTMLNAVALPFVAIIVLDAGPAAIAGLTAAGILPAFLVGLLASAWVDRLPRRLVMIAADWCRAAALAWIPIAAWLGVLSLLQLHVVVALHGLLSFLFGAASHAVLPRVVGVGDLIEANGRLKASEAVTEGAAFASGGWLVQALGAPLVLLVDALSYVGSAMFLIGLRVPEARRAEPAGDRSPAPGEMLAGLRFLLREPLLRPGAVSVALMVMGWRIAGVAYMLFVFEELGFQPGILGLVFSAGAISSFLGAMLAERVGPRLGVGRAMILGLGGFALAAFLLPLAPVATEPRTWAIALAVLVGHQLADGFEVLYEINQTSLQQTLTPDELLGRVDGAARFLSAGAALAGLFLGGLLGEHYGLRATLLVAAAVLAAGCLVLVASPIRGLRSLPAGVAAVSSADRSG